MAHQSPEKDGLPRLLWVLICLDLSQDTKKFLHFRPCIALLGLLEFAWVVRHLLLFLPEQGLDV